jgi:YD repeat-containing protein
LCVFRLCIRIKTRNKEMVMRSQEAGIVTRLNRKIFQVRFWVGLMVICLTLLSSAMAQQGGTTQYFYDDNGRLRAVILPSGETAIYEYDAAGNLLAIRRQNAAQVSISDFSPSSGAVGVSVIINGTGFGAATNTNTVKFNGITATIISATSTQIVANVPWGATTGSITVQTPTGSAVSIAFFTVSNQPVISGFTPVVASSGSVVTINGSKFGPSATDNQVQFAGIPATISDNTETSITTIVPAGVRSGRLSVTTLYGTALSANDFFVPPAGVPASRVIFTSRLTIGTPRTWAFSTTNTFALLAFDATAGQRLSLSVSPQGIAEGSITIYKPDGTVLIPATNAFFTDVIDMPPLPVTGTYTIAVNFVRGIPFTQARMTLNLVAVTDLTGSIILGSPTGLSFTSVGQNALYTFSGVTGQRISLAGNTFIGAGTNVSILKPDGTLLYGPGSITEFIEPQTLPVDGTYTVFVDPQSNGTGFVNFVLYDVPPDITGQMVIGGNAVNVNINTPGQNARLTFSGSAGQRLSLSIDDGAEGMVSIYNPDGTLLASTFTSSNSANAVIEPQILPVNGIYTIVVDPSTVRTGNFRLKLFEMPPDLSGSITIGGAAVPLTIDAPGQNAELTFSGTSGQQVTIHWSDSTISCVLVSILNPDGTTLFSEQRCGLSSYDLSTQVLPTSGTYRIKIDPLVNYTGSISISVTSP